MHQARGLLLTLSIALFVHSSATATATATATAGPSYLCPFENILVPCNKLHHHPDAMWGSDIAFRPTHSIPLWPNFSILGGLDPTKDWPTPSSKAPIAFDETRENIEKLTITPPEFSEASFVDPHLANISFWYDRRTQGHLLSLSRLDRVYHGQEVFKLWQKSISVRPTCADVILYKFLSPELSQERVHYCVFTRSKKVRSGQDIEYCYYQFYEQTGIRTEVTCTVVASEVAGVRKVLATRYTQWDFEGGASEGEYTCSLPKMDDERLSDIVKVFLRKMLGDASKYSENIDGTTHVYKAEGINILDRNENMFLRLYIFGERYSWRDKRRRAISRFKLNANVTVSAQSSDNIIDYREPTEASASRMKNVLHKKLNEYVASISKGARCKDMYGD